MAIAFSRVTIHSRTKGHSSVAASAYRTGTRQLDQRTGIVYDFSHRKDVVFQETLLPHHANEQFLQREFLWNQVELAEKRIDAQVCKDIVLALPKELDLTQHIELAKRFAITHFVENGLPVDIAIHDHGDGNPHAHILTTTRRLEQNAFSKYKARDLNPAFYSGKVIELDYWGEQWREFQNDFFKEKSIDLSVDLNHLIPERHEGRLRKTNSYLKQTNEMIRDERVHLALNHVDNLINHISMTHSVFTRRDIEQLIFKTLKHSSIEPTQFTGWVEKVIQHPDLIYLGVNDEGRDAYTTRNQYIAESHLLNAVEQLSTRKNHVSNHNTENLANKYQLNEEQREALQYVTEGSDLSVIIGRPGVGKSYLLKPLKEHYETQGYRVIGASLSGKVAKTLQSETDITSYTLASLNYRLQQKHLTLTKNDVLIIDEAGMVDFANLSSLITAVNKAQAKIILVGDPDQLKPIYKGEIFKAVAAHTGYIELSQIRRQYDLGDRAASLMLAKGDIQGALIHYHSKRAIRFSETPTESIKKMVHDWQQNITVYQDIKENMMFSFSRAAVSALNQEARQTLKDKRLLSDEEFTVNQISLAQGERILLRKNDATLGVRNGDMAFIESIEANQIKARLDSGELITLPKSYQHIDYGYATTVHKGQGMTVNNAKILIDSKYWDRFLSYVAMTRHRTELNLYADTHQHRDLEALHRTLSRSSTKDNVIDWPLDLAIRHGFDSDSLIGKAINHLADIGYKIKEKYNYLIHYENYMRQKIIQEYRESKQEIRNSAKEVADYLDEQAKYAALRKQITKKAQNLNVELSSLKEFKYLYEQSIARDKQAYAIWTKYQKQLCNIPLLKAHQKSIQTAAERYERYLIITDFAKHQPNNPLSEQQIQRSTQVNLKFDNIHIAQLAPQFSKKPSELLQQIKNAQKSYEKTTVLQLEKEHPTLMEYMNLLKKRNKTIGYKAQELEKRLMTKTQAIIQDKTLYSQLETKLPKLAQSLAALIRVSQLENTREK